jgi:hypothetical protein
MFRRKWSKTTTTYSLFLSKYWLLAFRAPALNTYRSFPLFSLFYWLHLPSPSNQPKLPLSSKWTKRQLGEPILPPSPAYHPHVLHTASATNYALLIFINWGPEPHKASSLLSSSLGKCCLQCEVNRPILYFLVSVEYASPCGPVLKYLIHQYLSSRT